MDTQSRHKFAQYALYAVHYIFLMVISVTQVGLAIWVHQLVIPLSMIYAVKLNNPWLPRTIDMWSMLILGVVVLVTIFGSEGYLNKGLRNNSFWKRARIIGLAEVIVAGLLWIGGLAL